MALVLLAVMNIAIKHLPCNMKICPAHSSITFNTHTCPTKPLIFTKIAILVQQKKSKTYKLCNHQFQLYPKYLTISPIGYSFVKIYQKLLKCASNTWYHNTFGLKGQKQFASCDLLSLLFRWSLTWHNDEYFETQCFCCLSHDMNLFRVTYDNFK